MQGGGLWGNNGFWGDLPMGSMINNPPLRYLIDASLAAANNPPPLSGGGGGGGGGNNPGNPYKGGKHSFVPSPGMGRKMFLPPSAGMKTKPPIKNKLMPPSNGVKGKLNQSRV